MKPSQFFQKFYLHDSIVNEIRHDPHKKECVFNIEFCNWMQDSYKDSDPEVILGDLIITGITMFEGDSPFDLFTKNEAIDAQILKTQHLSGNGGSETWKIVMLVTRYKEKSDNILVLTIRFEDIEWAPYG